MLSYGNLKQLEPRYGLQKTMRRLCGFELEDDDWIARPDVLFRPYALQLWDVPDAALITAALLGHRQQIKVSGAPVPARFFATGRSFEEVVRRFELEGIDAPYWCDFDTMELGHLFRLQVRFPGGTPVRDLRAVLLGLAAL